MRASVTNIQRLFSIEGKTALVTGRSAGVGAMIARAYVDAADGGALLWPQQIGYARAKEFLFTGRLVTMEEAAEIGLINYAVPREELDAKVNELAQAIASNAARAVQMTKAVMNLPLRQAAISSMELGLATEIISSQTEDHMEAANAFIEKREPHFKGR
jgi:enoyl-CoA hydratase